MHIASRLAAGALVLTLSTGCGMAMHGMCGMPDMHGGSSHSSHPPPTVAIAEVETEAAIATLVVPPLRLGREETLTLRVVDAQTSRPAEDLTVTFAIRPVGAGGSAHGTSHGGGAEQPASRHTGAVAPEGSGHGGEAQEAAITQVATEAHRGTYTLTHTFSQPGRFQIAATAARGGMPPCTVRATQEVRDAAADHGAPRRLAPLALVGGVAMAVMMALKLAWL